MRPAVLFSSVCKPYDKMIGRFLPSDQMGNALTRGQDLFVMYEHTHFNPLHLMAQNVTGPSVVLEYPTMEQFARELEEGYDYVCISANVNNLERLLEMCACTREKSPHSKIVVGGYGVLCTPILFEQPEWEGKIDEVCRGEGIGFMRDLLGTPADMEQQCRLPKGGFSLPWLNPNSVGNIGVVLSGLGCTHRCPFCNTSAYTGGAYVDVMNARQIYRAMSGYWEHAPFLYSVIVYDENFLDHRDKVDELGRLIRHDSRFGLRRLNYFSFSSISAISGYDPDEILLNGVDTLFIGVESKFSPLGKRQGLDAREAFGMLHSIGVKTVGSWIIGEDFQSPDNLPEDMAYFLSMDPTFQQLSVLFVTPTLPFWSKLKAEGRIPENVPWGEYHIYGKTFVPKHFTHEQMLEHLDGMYTGVYQENGPTIMKNLAVNLNGYEWCRRSANRLLSVDRAAYFRAHCETAFPLARTARAFAPTERVRKRIDDITHRYREIFGHAAAEKQRKIEERIYRKACKEWERRQSEPLPPKEEPFRRYTYPPMQARSPLNPYTVEYPPCK